MGKGRVRRLAILERRIGLCFLDKSLLNQAFVHRSYANLHGVSSNERLEFLGDSVLNFAVSEILYQRNRSWDEGLLTRVRSQLVSRRVLCTVASSFSLSSYILIANSLGLRSSVNETGILGNVFESLLGAIYLSFGYEKALNWVLSHFQIFLDVEGSIKELLSRDYKSHLQVLVQRRCGIVPVYKVVSVEGPDHNQIITSQVSVDGWFCEKGVGRSSKKEAEQSAAQFVLSLLIQT